MKFLLRLTVSAVFFAALAACSASPSPEEEGTGIPDLNDAVAPTIPVTAAAENPTQPPAQPTVPPVAPSATALDDFIAAIESGNVDALSGYLGDAFDLQFLDGQSGVVAAADALTVIQEQFYTDTSSVTVDRAGDVAAALGYDPVLDSAEIDLALLSRGWGTNATDEAVLLLSLAETGELTWFGIAYARNGFDPVVVEGGESAPSEEEASDPTPTAIAAVPAEPNRPEVGEMLYETNFQGGWPAFDTGTATSVETGGGYQISVLDQALWTYTTRFAESEFFAEITASPQVCAADGNYGLLLNWVSDTEFYAFVAWCDGVYSLLHRTGASTIFSVVDGVLPSGIDAATQSVTLGVLSEGGQVSLYANDVPLETVGEALTGGDFGPYVGSAANQETTVLFTRMAIFRP
ncbi:MAG: hypothetical protein GYB68_09190 [Chloroflexi bacterium]|nr:hypothetical protein [Chloroflexota bacterium]